jgi:hypothetical protein
VRNKRTLDFRSSQAMATDVNHVVYAAHDPKVSILIAARAVAGKINILDL